MSRLIDGDALIPKLNFIQEAEHQIYDKGSWGFVSKCITAIEDAPTIEERKTGKWIYDGDCYICNQCKSAFSWWADSQTSNFCPNCGSDNRWGK